LIVRTVFANVVAVVSGACVFTLRAAYAAMVVCLNLAQERKGDEDGDNLHFVLVQEKPQYKLGTMPVEGGLIGHTELEPKWIQVCMIACMCE